MVEFAWDRGCAPLARSAATQELLERCSKRARHRVHIVVTKARDRKRVPHPGAAVPIVQQQHQAFALAECAVRRRDRRAHRNAHPKQAGAIELQSHHPTAKSSATMSSSCAVAAKLRLSAAPISENTRRTNAIAKGKVNRGSVPDGLPATHAAAITKK